MKILWTIATLLLGTAMLHAQDTRSQEKQNAQTQQQEIDEDEELIGDDNNKDERKRSDDEQSNYRNNKVSGNPNNRSNDEGSNRRSQPVQRTNESSDAAPAVNPHGTNQQVQDLGSSTPVDEIRDAGNDATDSTRSEASGDTGLNSGNRTDASGTIDKSASGSGSPAVGASEELDGKDGTNTKQKASRNMVGSDAKGLPLGKESVNEDEEVRRATRQNPNTGTDNVGRADQVDSTEVQRNKELSEQRKRSEGQPKQKKTATNSNRERVVSPQSESRGGSGVKQPIDSEAENTNGREVDDQSADMNQVEAMDEGANATQDVKESKREKRKARREKRRRDRG